MIVFGLGMGSLGPVRPLSNVYHLATCLWDSLFPFSRQTSRGWDTFSALVANPVKRWGGVRTGREGICTPWRKQNQLLLLGLFYIFEIGSCRLRKRIVGSV